MAIAALGLFILSRTLRLEFATGVRSGGRGAGLSCSKLPTSCSLLLQKTFGCANNWRRALPANAGRCISDVESLSSATVPMPLLNLEHPPRLLRVGDGGGGDAVCTSSLFLVVRPSPTANPGKTTPHTIEGGVGAETIDSSFCSVGAIDPIENLGAGIPSASLNEGGGGILSSIS